MGAVAITSQKQPAGRAAEPTPQTQRRFHFARQQEMQTQLQQLKFTMKKLQEDKDVVMNEIRHRVDKRMLMKHIMELKDSVWSLKLTINNLKKDREERMEIQKKLQEEFQTLRIINNKFQKKYETVIAIEVNLRTKLEQLKTANENINKYWKSEMKDCEEENKILVIQKEELRK